MLWTKVKQEVSVVPCKVLLFCAIAAAALLFCTYTQLWTSGFFSATATPHLESNRTENSDPMILAWTPYFSVNLAEHLKSDIATCKYKCAFTDNKSYLEVSNAVVFHIRDLNVSDLPSVRLPYQYYVFFLLESPFHTGNVLEEAGSTGKEARIPNDFFNMTMTYRKDGDVFAGYGKLARSSRRKWESPFWNYDEVERSLLKREKSVLQFVSHCPTSSQRELYVDELRKYIDVTQIGSCGIKNCSKFCEQQAIREHVFYLSFENSICRDYVTEKLFSWLGKFLPIVLKRSTYEGIIPNDAFIAADDFRSPKELAEHLIFLRSNHTALMRYFEWMRFYENAKPSPGCDLCTILYQERGTPKVVKDVSKWWFEESYCEPNYVSKMFSKSGYTKQ